MLFIIIIKITFFQLLIITLKKEKFNNFYIFCSIKWYFQWMNRKTKWGIKCETKDFWFLIVWEIPLRGRTIEARVGVRRRGDSHMKIVIQQSYNDCINLFPINILGFHVFDEWLDASEGRDIDLTLLVNEYNDKNLFIFLVSYNCIDVNN